MAQDIWRVTLRVIKQVTIKAKNDSAARLTAILDEDMANVISVDVEDQYKVDNEGRPIE